MGDSEAFKTESPPATSSSLRDRSRLLLAAVVILGVAVCGLGYAQYQTSRSLAGQFHRALAQVNQLEARTAVLENDNAALRADLRTTTENLGRTQKQLAQARAQARKHVEQQERTAAELNSELAEQEGLLDSISGDISTLKGDVATTRATLDRAVGDLGVQSGLIARNWEELEQLKGLGERSYFDFILRKSPGFTRVGDVAVRLHKTDTKRNRYTVTLIVSDKHIEKKDKTLLEPVQFYLPGSRQLLEIVVFELKKDRVAGYLSVPKEVASVRLTN